MTDRPRAPRNLLAQEREFITKIIRMTVEAWERDRANGIAWPAIDEAELMSHPPPIRSLTYGKK